MVNLSYFRLILYANVCLMLALDIRPEIYKYCRDKNRLITSKENDEYLLVEAEVNTTILLECHFCGYSDDNQPKIWHLQDLYQSQSVKEVDLGMDNNMSYNRIHVTLEYSLVIKSFQMSDKGIYRCHGQVGQEEEYKFNYRLEPVFKQKDISVEKGNITEWEKYHEVNMAPVTMRFSISTMSDLVEIREAGIILEVVSEWGLWSRCERCIRKIGFKTSRGYCRIKRHIDDALMKDRTSSVAKLFLKSPALPCRSILLMEQFPGISRATRYLPEFILEEKCKNCIKVKKKKKSRFKYKKRYVLAEGAHLAITCPESNLETLVVWRKDALLLKKGMGQSFRKKDPDPRVLVDTFATLYLVGVSHAEEGNYTCYVDNVNMMQVKVIVVSKSRLLTQAFLRHMGYLGFIFLLSSFCYCAGLVIVCRNKDKFKVKDFEEIEAKRKNLPKF
ncbi:uncharacterized protein LOC107266555 isoform X1 [Cephus cinctus]|uniref:Uncharacterized protein LOC107266555 isoform X1 n=1 Tax=Cephus cinctus TaxID=211228 RepID=A0AAJ7W0W4_CEPCN|nr:uncharacterized protein LOC107266555 isoform X1 [Cephus cinctus]